MASLNLSANSVCSICGTWSLDAPSGNLASPSNLWAPIQSGARKLIRLNFVSDSDQVRQRQVPDIDPGRIDGHADVKLSRHDLRRVEWWRWFDRRDFVCRRNRRHLRAEQ